MLVKRMKTLCQIVLASMLCACGSPPQLSLTQGAVTFEELQSAVETVFGIDYLPFSQIKDGCYARSLYMAMELASLGIPVSSQFLIATKGSLNPVTDIHWNYHVAPAVWLKDFSEPFILDPSLFTHVSGRNAWIEKLNPTETYELKFAPASETVVTSASLKMGPKIRSEMIKSAEEIGEFRASDVTNSCRTMETSIQQETNLRIEQKALKIRRLIERTKYLLTRLKALGLGPESSLISNDPSSCY